MRAPAGVLSAAAAALPMPRPTCKSGRFAVWGMVAFAPALLLAGCAAEIRDDTPLYRAPAIANTIDGVVFGRATGSLT